MGQEERKLLSLPSLSKYSTNLCQTQTFPGANILRKACVSCLPRRCVLRRSSHITVVGTVQVYMS